MRSQNGLTQTLWVYLESFDRKVGYLNRQRVVQLPHLSNDTRQIAALGSEAVAKIFVPHIRYKKCGIGLLDVRTKKYEQRDFFAAEQPDQSRRLMTVMDAVNRRYGKYTVKLANTGVNPKWSMKRDYMSPRYTTRWRDIPVVRC
jgi:DNA polymerase V